MTDNYIERIGSGLPEYFEKLCVMLSAIEHSGISISLSDSREFTPEEREKYNISLRVWNSLTARDILEISGEHLPPSSFGTRTSSSPSFKEFQRIYDKKYGELMAIHIISKCMPTRSSYQVPKNYFPDCDI